MPEDTNEEGDFHDEIQAGNESEINDDVWIGENVPEIGEEDERKIHDRRYEG